MATKLLSVLGRCEKQAETPSPSPLHKSHLISSIQYINSSLSTLQSEINPDLFTEISNRLSTLEKVVGVEKFRLSTVVSDPLELQFDGGEVNQNEDDFRITLQKKVEEMLENFKDEPVPDTTIEEEVIKEHIPLKRNSVSSSIELRTELFGNQTLRHRHDTHAERSIPTPETQEMDTLIQSQKKLHDELTNDLIRMAGSLKESNIRFSDLLKKDAEVIQNASEKLETSVSRITRERSRLGFLNVRSWSTFWIMWGIVIITVILFIFTFMFMRLFKPIKY